MIKISQWMEYAEKKGDYLCDLAAEHLRSREPEKAKQLLNQAIGWYKKAGLEEKIEIVNNKLKELG
ncbi:MAG: hypothetical protein EU551_02880 [Promethearchaeota archaeon]|nr:MAG: hypothetical protein EU551_02880 [Candidatus Lokiarchaeota archaeon]